jgi:hypothetical protein
VRSGQGHIVVLGDSQHEAAMFVDSVLARTSGYDVAQISIRRLGAVSPDKLANEAVLIVVHDADSASAADLEELRIVLERDPGAVERVRFILVGSARLEHALNDPMARALNSRIGARVRLVRKTAQRHAAPVVQSNSKKKWALRVSAFSACAALVCTVATGFLKPEARTALFGVTAEQVTAASEAVRSLMASFETSNAGSEKKAPTAPVEVASAAPVAHAAAPATSGSSFGERFADFVEKAAYAAGRAPSAWSQAASVSSAHASAKPAKSSWRPAPKPSTSPSQSGGFFATLARLFVRDSHGQKRSVETGGAVLETALMTAKLARSAGENVLELGSFAHPDKAYDLKSSLAGQFDRVAVARFDPPSGPVYSVRVFDGEGQQAAAAPQTANR